MRRRLSTLLLTLGALFLVGAMAAWACTNLATLNLEKASGNAGETIGVTGSSFATAGSRYDEVSPVEIRWDGVEGQVLSSVEADEAGNIATSIRIPADAAPGYHVLVATQSVTSDGEVSAAYGTPARAAFSVGGPVPEAPAVATGPSSVVGSAGTSSGLVALTALLAIAGLALFGAGVGLFVRELRPREAPAPAKTEK